MSGKTSPFRRDEDLFNIHYFPKDRNDAQHPFVSASTSISHTNAISCAEESSKGTQYPFLSSFLQYDRRFTSSNSPPPSTSLSQHRNESPSSFPTSARYRSSSLTYEPRTRWEIPSRQLFIDEEEDSEEEAERSGQKSAAHWQQDPRRHLPMSNGRAYEDRHPSFQDGLAYGGVQLNTEGSSEAYAPYASRHSSPLPYPPASSSSTCGTSSLPRDSFQTSMESGVSPLYGLQKDRRYPTQYEDGPPSSYRVPQRSKQGNPLRTGPARPSAMTSLTLHSRDTHPLTHHTPNFPSSRTMDHRGGTHPLRGSGVPTAVHGASPISPSQGSTRRSDGLLTVEGTHPSSLRTRRSVSALSRPPSTSTSSHGGREVRRSTMPKRDPKRKEEEKRGRGTGEGHPSMDATKGGGDRRLATMPYAGEAGRPHGSSPWAGGGTPTRWSDTQREGGDDKRRGEVVARPPFPVDVSPHPTSYASSATHSTPRTHGRSQSSSVWQRGTCFPLPLSPPQASLDRGSTSPFRVPFGGTSSIPDATTVSTRRPPLPPSAWSSASGLRRSESTLRHYLLDTSHPLLSSSARREHPAEGSSVLSHRPSGSSIERGAEEKENVQRKSGSVRRRQNHEAVPPLKRSKTREADAQGHTKRHPIRRSQSSHRKTKSASGRKEPKRERSDARRDNSVGGGGRGEKKVSARAARPQEREAEQRRLTSTASTTSPAHIAGVPSHPTDPATDPRRESLPPRRSLLHPPHRGHEDDAGPKHITCRSSAVERGGSQPSQGTSLPSPSMPPLSRTTTRREGRPRSRDASEDGRAKDTFPRSVKADGSAHRQTISSGRSSVVQEEKKKAEDGPRPLRGSIRLSQEEKGLRHRSSSRLSAAAAAAIGTTPTTPQSDADPYEKHPTGHLPTRKTTTRSSTARKEERKHPPASPTRHVSRAGKKSSVGRGMTVREGKNVASSPTHRERIKGVERGSGRGGPLPHGEKPVKERRSSRHCRASRPASQTSSSEAKAIPASPRGYRALSTSSTSLQRPGQARQKESHFYDPAVASPSSQVPFPLRATTASTLGQRVEPDAWDWCRQGTTAAILRASDAPLRIAYRKGMQPDRGSCAPSYGVARSSSSSLAKASPCRSPIGVKAFSTRADESDARANNGREELRVPPNRPTVGRFSGTHKVAPGRASGAQ